MKTLLWLILAILIIAQGKQVDDKQQKSATSVAKLSSEGSKQSNPALKVKELILAQNRNMMRNSNETAMDVLRDNKRSAAKKAWDIIPETMSKEELTVYLVIFFLIIIVCCVFCFVLKQILMFGILIAIFCAGTFWYLYIYRNKDD